jgi:hypothetical protein
MAFFPSIAKALGRDSDNLLQPGVDQKQDNQPQTSMGGSSAGLDLTSGGATNDQAVAKQSAADFTKSGFQDAQQIIDRNRDVKLDRATDIGQRVSDAGRKLGDAAAAYQPKYTSGVNDDTLKHYGESGYDSSTVDNVLNYAPTAKQFDYKPDDADAIAKDLYNLGTTTGLQNKLLKDAEGQGASYGDKDAFIDSSIIGGGEAYQAKLRGLGQQLANYRSRIGDTQTQADKQYQDYLAAIAGDQDRVKSALSADAEIMKSGLAQRLLDAQKSRKDDFAAHATDADNANAATVSGSINSAVAKNQAEAKRLISAAEADPEHWDSPRLSALKLALTNSNLEFEKNLRSKYANAGAGQLSSKGDLQLSDVTNADDALRFSKIMHALGRGDTLDQTTAAPVTYTSSFNPDALNTTLTGEYDTSAKALQGIWDDNRGPDAAPAAHPNVATEVSSGLKDMQQAGGGLLHKVGIDTGGDAVRESSRVAVDAPLQAAEYLDPTGIVRKIDKAAGVHEGIDRAVRKVGEVSDNLANGVAEVFNPSKKEDDPWDTYKQQQQAYENKVQENLPAAQAQVASGGVNEKPSVSDASARNLAQTMAGPAPTPPPISTKDMSTGNLSMGGGFSGGGK